MILKPYVLQFFFFLLILHACSGFTEEKDQAKLLLISIDGFRADYTELYNTPNLDRIAANGVTADYMIPVFPTKTFPNHYSIATGLYVENSGIVSNNMYDPDRDQYYSLADREAIQDASWYSGEPIWVTAEKQGIPTAPLFWPGSEAQIGGSYATRWSPYDDDLAYSARVDSVITWMELEDNTAPGFMTLYFSKVDTYGHRYGPESDSVATAVQEVDQYIGYLLDQLDRIKKTDQLNIIIVSDHGMTNVSEENVIVLDTIFNLTDAEVTDWAPVTTIRPDEGKTEEIYQLLKEAENNYTVYKKSDIPDDYGYKNHIRVPDIILVAEPGFTVTSSDRLADRNISGGNHGYSHTEPEMRSFFMAVGPDIKRGVKTPPFQNIHVYELMAELLKIDPAINNGDLDSLKHILN